MNFRVALFASIGINVALGAAVLRWGTRTSAPALEPSRVEPAVSPHRTMAPARVIPISVAAPATNFHWSAIESSDFGHYMRNLRSIGCPEETIRDLIISEVDELFAPRFAALAGQARGYAYWKSGNRQSVTSLREQLQMLQKEKRDLLNALLGIPSDPNEKWANLSVEDVVELGRYGFLPAEKAEQVRAIMEKYKHLESTRRSGDLTTGPDGTKKLREQRRDELAQLLTPQELHELDLRDSNTADSVRSRFGSADLTEEEYRKLFALRKAYEDEHGATPDYSDPEKMRRRSEARRDLDAAYRESLGPERNAEIQKQQDPSWRGLASVGQQHNLPQSTIEQAYQAQRVASEQVAALMSDASIPRDQQRETMKRIQEELESHLTGLIGPNAYKDFRNSSPQFYFSSGGDTVVLSSPLPERPIVDGALQRRVTTIDNTGQADTRVTITVP